MPLSQVLEVLQLHSGVVQTALLTYSDQKPFEQDLSVDLNQDGVRLYFDPLSQRLKVCACAKVLLCLVCCIYYSFRS